MSSLHPGACSPAGGVRTSTLGATCPLGDPLNRCDEAPDGVMERTAPGDPSAASTRGSAAVMLRRPPGEPSASADRGGDVRPMSCDDPAEVTIEHSPRQSCHRNSSSPNNASSPYSPYDSPADDLYYSGNSNSSAWDDKGAARSSDLKVVVPIVVVCALALCVAVIWLICWLPRKKSNDEETPPLRPSLAEDGRPKQLTLRKIKRATKNFGQLLGQGAFGKVYLGQLQGKQTAVKELTREQFKSVPAKQFESEMGILMKVKHKNLVKLLAYCNKGAHKFLCFEYLSGGSLDKILYDGQLDWKTRYHIIREVRSGLHYLHAESDNQEKILHMDLRASNILLDQGGRVVKIADFGISRLLDAEKPHEYVRDAYIGIKAYLPPECLNDKPKVSEKLDIYSYGMLLLEMVTGWRATDKHFPGVPKFLEKANNALASQDVQNLLDPNLEVNCHSMRVEVLKCIDITVNCLDSNPNRRPDTRQIAQKLDSERNLG